MEYKLEIYEFLGRSYYEKDAQVISREMTKLASEGWVVDKITPCTNGTGNLDDYNVDNHLDGEITLQPALIVLYRRD